MQRNIAIYPRFKFFQNLVFWQAIWFLYFQNQLSAAEAILLYAVYDVGTTVLEVPSGYMSDRLGRKKTLCAAAIAASIGAGLLAFGSGLFVFVLAQICIGAGAAFASGTDSALLYESLVAEGREAETEVQETKAWRANLMALALSAALGGAMAQWSFTLPFICTVVASAVTLAITLQFHEPPKARRAQKPGLSDHWAMLRRALGKPVLAWLFVLSVLMYGFSHVPFVFGQPFIAEVLGQQGWQSEAPMVSGVVTALMMGVSVLATLVAIRLRHWLACDLVVGVWHSDWVDCGSGLGGQCAGHFGAVSADGAKFMGAALYHGDCATFVG